MPEGDNPQGGENKAEALQKLLDKNNGDAMRTLGILFSENFDLRNKNRTLKEQVPAEGSAVLSKADADRLAAFDALGLKPEEAKAKIESAGTVEAENASLKREAQRNALVELGYSRAALADFDALEGSAIESYEVKEGQKDGKAVKVAYVTVEGKQRPLDEYATEKRPAQAKILRESGQQQTGGVAYVPQSAGGSAPSKNEFDEIREQVKTAQKTAQPKDTASVLAALGGQRAAATN